MTRSALIGRAYDARVLTSQEASAAYEETWPRCVCGCGLPGKFKAGEEALCVDAFERRLRALAADETLIAWEQRHGS